MHEATGSTLSYHANKLSWTSLSVPVLVLTFCPQGLLGAITKPTGYDTSVPANQNFPPRAVDTTGLVATQVRHQHLPYAAAVWSGPSKEPLVQISLVLRQLGLPR